MRRRAGAVRRSGVTGEANLYCSLRPVSGVRTSAEPCGRAESRNTVKPSAQPTLVRTQHLPPPAKTARSLRKRGPAGRFLLVTTPCISGCHYGSMCRGGCVHMVYSERPEGAVRITARFADLRPFCPIIRAPGLLV